MTRDSLQGKTIKWLAVFASIFIFSCEPQTKPTPVCAEPDQSDWITLHLINGWQLKAPPGFKLDTTFGGVDSEYGGIFSKTDSLGIVFECGISLKAQLRADSECSFEKEVERAKESLKWDYYKEHRAYVDTINGRIAIIYKPNPEVRKTLGKISLQISDCKSGNWIGFSAKVYPLSREENIFSGIFKTIKYIEQAETEYSEFTCPKCGHKKMEALPTDVCLLKYTCESCKADIFPKEGDCCVFCSYGSVKCPSKQ